MNFEDALKRLIENGIASFNSGDYDSMLGLLSENAELISPEIKKGTFFSPEIHAKNREEIISYWKAINANFDNRITDIKYVQTGKHAIINCYYSHIDLVVVTDIYMNEYGIIFKIVNKLTDTH